MQQNLIVISLFVLFTGYTTTPQGIPAFRLGKRKKMTMVIINIVLFGLMES